MKTVEGFKLRTLGDDRILVAEGLKQIDFGKMISLNETACWLYQQIEGKEFAVSDVVSLLKNEYGIDDDLAQRDAASFCESLLKAGAFIE